MGALGRASEDAVVGERVGGREGEGTGDGVGDGARAEVGTGETVEGVNPRAGTDPDLDTFFLGMNFLKIGFTFTVTCTSSPPPPDDEEDEEDDDDDKEEMGTEESEGWEMSLGEGG